MDEQIAAFNALVVEHKKEVAAELRAVAESADSKNDTLYAETGQNGVLAQTKAICIQLANQLDPPPAVG